ncbi:MAG TPA: circadian clock protein KaiC [Terriglobales bacterium]|nr:circadian clock protein KaiC [Terriglobales bacterium]
MSIRNAGKTRVRPADKLPKSPTGIRGLDEVTLGGLPSGRPTLVCGGAGCGKTIFGLEFLVRGAREYGEAGVFMSFEETDRELTTNVASMGFDLKGLVDAGKLAIDQVRIDRADIEETGEYDLEGIFVRLQQAVESVKAKRVVLDTIESLFSAFSNETILRAELRRLFRWLKDRNLTAIITGESGERTLTRFGLEEYVADCVIVLDHRVTNQACTRRLRVVKYRGTIHGTGEYPFMIGKHGISVLPITSLELGHEVTDKRISSGIARLDDMLGGRGYYAGSSILVSGSAGTGKSSLAAHFVDATCRRGERALYFASEESPAQIIRNMRSIGLNLSHWTAVGRLRFHAARPTFYGLEKYLVTIQDEMLAFAPQVVVFDPISSLSAIGQFQDVQSMMSRMIDLFKNHGITALFTSLVGGQDAVEQSEVGVSSLMDTWILLRNLESDGERNRGLYVLKSRGMAHSNQIREFLLTSRGIRLVDVYVGNAGMLTGSARIAREAEERARALARKQDVESKQLQLKRRYEEMTAQISSLRRQYRAEKAQVQREIREIKKQAHQLASDEAVMAIQRHADRGSNNGHGPHTQSARDEVTQHAN